MVADKKAGESPPPQTPKKSRTWSRSGSMLATANYRLEITRLNKAIKGHTSLVRMGIVG